MDGSFQVLMVPGLNADPLGRPLEWSFAGETGGGASDHFPVTIDLDLTTQKTA